MQMDDPQLKELHEAFLSAFPTRPDLEMMVAYGFHENLSAIAGGGSLEQTVFELLRWAQARGRREELVAAALSENPQNPLLIRVAKLLKVSRGQLRIWNIPYLRNPVFTGREDLLSELADTLRKNIPTALSQRQALSGLGGIGKTQVAVEYAHRHQQDYQAVLWTLADTEDALVSGYVAIAGLLDLPSKDEQDQTKTVEAVKRWLGTHKEWLLILDNADDLSIVRSFLPARFDGHILLTTRRSAMGGLASRIEVDIMPEEVGALLLLRRAGLIGPDVHLEDADATDVEMARTICKELGGLPLALDQAGAYIEEIPCSLEDYLHLYRDRGAEMLKTRGQHFMNDHPEPVAITWLLSFEKVEQKNPAAAELLRLCAYLSPDAIPEEIVTKGADHLGSVLGSVASDPMLLNAAISVLGAYSLIRRNVKEKTLSVHRLVQAVLCDAMKEQEVIQWVERASRLVDQAFPQSGAFEQWDACAHYLPHVLASFSHVKAEGIVVPEVADMLRRAGWYLGERGQFSEAEELLRSALRLQEQGEKKDEMAVARAALALAWLCNRQGKYAEEAEPLFQQALGIMERQLGPQHHETAQCLNSLAVLYKTQGKYETAEPLYQRALSIREEQLGSTHPETAQSLNNLAALYYAQGKYEQTEPLLKRALSIREEQLGPTHPHTASSLNNLAALYLAQGKYEQAEPVLKRARAIDEKAYGTDHPDVARDLHNLARLYENQGKYEEAVPLFQRALTILEQTLGPDHPNTQSTRQWYDSSLSKMGTET